MKLTTFAATLFFAATAAATAADAATIVPHRAIYDLRLIRSNQGASLSGVDGRLAFEVAGSPCEGWTVSFRMVNQFRPAEGAGKLIDTQSTSDESGDGLDLHYSQKEFIDNRLDRESRVKVSRQATQGEGKGKIELPAPKDFTVPAEALFPMRHQLKLMDAARAGETRDKSLLYDGSDGEKMFRAISFIGKRKEAGSNARDKPNAEAVALAGLPSWPMTISYYDVAGGDQDTPIYQIGFDMYENGVATGLVLDYGDFALDGELANLELRDAETCE
ncbi:MAG: EipB family protein [Hyphomicrobiales bacterium]